MVKSKK